MASVMVGSPASAHSKLHKRHPSAIPGFSSGEAPKAPNPVVKRLSLDHKRSIGQSDASDSGSTPPTSPLSSSLKLRSPMKRSSARDSGLVDLSRSITENESLTGLGLGSHDSGPLDDYSGGSSFSPKTASDVSFVPVRGTRHNRSTSNTSQYSARNSGSFQRGTTPYAHPMRQTPRPYTPPISRSITMSTGGNSSGEEERAASGALLFNADDASPPKGLIRNATGDTTGRPDSVTSFPAMPSASPGPSNSLFTLESNARFSIASATSQPAGLRSRGATLQSVDTGGSSRPSMEKAINFLRTQRSNTTGTDVETIASTPDRAANIRAARAAYQEREEAKERKAEKEEMRQAERERRRRDRRSGKASRKGSRAENGTFRPGSGTSESVVPEDDEKALGAAGVEGSEYASARPNSRSTPPTQVARTSHGLQPSDETAARASAAAAKRKRNAKSRWALFIAWLRTRLLRMRS